MEDSNGGSGITKFEGLLLEIPVDLIRPYSNQPRKEFNQEELDGLAESIEIVGQKQAITVRPINDGKDEKYLYELTDGERRLRSCISNGKKTILALVQPVDSEEEQFLDSVVSNFCRAGHTPLETAHALERLINQFKSKNGHTDESQIIDKVAKICGRSTSWARQHLGLLRLCPEVQELISTKKLLYQIGVSLTNMKPEYQIPFARHIIKFELNFKQALHYVRMHRDVEKLSPGGRRRPPSEDYERLQRFLNRSEEWIGIINDMPFKKFEDMLKNRSNEELSRVILLLEDLSEEILILVGTFKEVKTKKINGQYQNQTNLVAEVN